MLHICLRCKAVGVGAAPYCLSFTEYAMPKWANTGVRPYLLTSTKIELDSPGLLTQAMRSIAGGVGERVPPQKKSTICVFPCYSYHRPVGRVLARFEKTPEIS